MSFLNLSRQRIIIGLTITFTAIAYLANSSEIKAQSRQPIDDIIRAKKVSFNPPPVADNGAPGGRRKGAGSHSLCEITNQQTGTSPLIALMPEIPIETKIKSKTYIWGKTALDHPNFWFYVAYPAHTHAEFVLQDEAENEIYQTTFILEKTSGIVSLTLPKDRINLETDKSYHWYFNIMCDPEDTTDDFVEGWIEKIKLNPTINSQLESVPPLKRISIYAENGLWYDTLNHLDRLRQEEPENQEFANIWDDLLQQVGLGEISQETVVKRYNLSD